MLFITDSVKSEDLNNINNFFNEFENDGINITNPDEIKESNVSKYLTSLVSAQYQKSVDDIENTSVSSNKAVRRKNFQQVMQESFFYGANRFGNNFIA